MNDKTTQLIIEIKDKESLIRRLGMEIKKAKTRLPVLWYAFQNLPDLLIVSESRDECVRHMNSIGMQVNVVGQCYYVEELGGDVNAWLYSANPLDEIWPKLQEFISRNENADT